MEQRLLVPTASFLGGLAVWLVLGLLYATVASSEAMSPWSALARSAMPGGLIVLSVVRCRQAGGPKVGNVVRACVLLVMAAVTYLAGPVVAAILVACAAGTGGLLLLRPVEVPAPREAAAPPHS